MTEKNSWYEEWLDKKGYEKGTEPVGNKFHTHMERCPRCDEVMLDVQACHLICPRCGGHMDCSDKGAVW